MYLNCVVSFQILHDKLGDRVKASSLFLGQKSGEQGAHSTDKSRLPLFKHAAVDPSCGSVPNQFLTLDRAPSYLGLKT